ncbi:hypothetical protein Bca4012_052351 [Brassica carinata]
MSIRVRYSLNKAGFSLHFALLSGIPWLILGDFNQVKCANEHSKSDRLSSTRVMRDFDNCLATTFISDLPLCGNRLLGQIIKGVFGNSGMSDHSLCCVFLDSHKPKQKKLFKFFTMLNDNQEFSVLLKEGWNAFQFHGSSMFKVSRKLKELKSIICTTHALKIGSGNLLRNFFNTKMSCLTLLLLTLLLRNGNPIVSGCYYQKLRSLFSINALALTGLTKVIRAPYVFIAQCVLANHRTKSSSSWTIMMLF